MIKKAISFYWRAAERLLSPDHNSVTQKVQLIYGLLTVFYGFVFYRSIEAVYKGNFNYLTGMSDQYLPKWPMTILNHIVNLNLEDSIRYVLVFSLCSGLLGFFYGVQNRLIRIFSFIGILLNVALINSFGKGSHAFHLGLIISFFLIFIPSKSNNSIENSESENADLIKIIFTIRNLILLSYFSGGTIKFIRLIQHFCEGKMTAIHKFGFSNLVAKDWYFTGEATMLGPFIVQNESYLWPITLMAGYLIEFLAGAVIFFPKFDRVWFVLFVFLHIGIILTLGPNFVEHLFVVALFIGFSVFSNSEKEGAKKILRV